MGFSRQEYWSGLPFPFPGDLPDPGIKPRSPALQADSLLTELQGKLSLLVIVLRRKKKLEIITGNKSAVGFPLGLDNKEPACNVGDLGLIPGSGRSSGEGNGSPLHYSCLENPMDRGS